MTRSVARSLIFVAVSLSSACGDNSKQCGDGTEEHNGVCVPVGENELLCGDGTVKDELTNECVPSDTVCGNGTVLINGRCQDPTAGLVIDLEEGPEPNGFDIGATPAGTITLKAPGGDGFVIHGCIKPLDNNSPDLDVYELTVAAPTLLKMTADGVEGLAAGFIVFGDDPSLRTWFRLGLNVTTDTSKRELFLPVAGTYEIVMADTRTLLPITQNGEGFPAAGNPDGSSCYYVTVTQETLPNPESLDLATGATGTIGEDLKFFSAPFPTGFISLTAVIDPEDINNDGVPDIDSRAASSLILLDNSQVRQINDAGNGAPASTPVSTMVFGGIKSTDNALVLLDYVWNIAAFPANFAIDVDAATSSQALSITGTAVNATSKGQAFLDGAGNAVFDNVNLFHFDVTAANEIDGIDIAFSIPVQGSIVDQDGHFASPFTGLIAQSNGNPTINTFTSYKGLLRNTAPGRYYFFVFAPRNPVNTAFTVTSTITPQTPSTVALDTPTAAIPVNAFNSNVVTYNAGTEPWQLLDGTGTNTGNVQVSLFDPTNTVPQSPGFAFGRLDPLQTTLNNNAPVTKQGDGTPLIVATYAASGATPVGRILKNPLSLQPPAVTDFLVKVNPAAPTTSPTFVLDFETRVYEDFGGPTIVAPATKIDSGTITAGSSERYYFETVPGNIVTITVTPTGAPATLNAALVLLDTGEGERTVIDNALLTGAETITFTQGLSGFTAFKVRGSNGVSIGGFDVSVQVAAGAYQIAPSTTAFSNACLGGTSVTLIDDGSNFGGNDEGLSAPIAAPAGFQLFGAAVTNFVVSSNGFLSFKSGITSAGGDNEALPDGIGEVNIAPYNDDLETSVCTKTVAGKLVVQWTGDDFTVPIQFQAILDPTTSSIEFVYGPNQSANGSSATVGVQNVAGSNAEQLGFNEAIVSRNTSVKLTPQ